MASTTTPSQIAAQRPLVAPAWHTAVLVLAMITYSFLAARSRHDRMPLGRLGLYGFTICLEILLVLYVFFGIRSRGVTLRSLTGGRWTSIEDVLLDIGIAAGAWLTIVFVMAGIAIAMKLTTPEKMSEMRRAIDFLLPQSRLELALWAALSATAGICEEIVFRGYMQQQFSALTGSMLAAIALQGTIFGACHGYEGWQRMLLIAVMGALLGLLAWWRKSLRPGMMAHAWQDLLAGWASHFFPH